MWYEALSLKRHSAHRDANNVSLGSKPRPRESSNKHAESIVGPQTAVYAVELIVFRNVRAGTFNFAEK